MPARKVSLIDVVRIGIVTSFAGSGGRLTRVVVTGWLLLLMWGEPCSVAYNSRSSDEGLESHHVSGRSGVIDQLWAEGCAGWDLLDGNKFVAVGTLSAMFC
jgi:hypothetical protein